MIKYMSDLGGGGQNQFAGEIKQAVQEISMDVKDQVGQAIEQGVQSVVGQQLSPQQIQQKEEEKQKRLAEVRWKLERLKKTEQQVGQMREENQQKDAQRLKEWEEKNKRDAQEKALRNQQIISPAKQTPQAPGQAVEQREELQRSKQELRAGHGIGG